MSSEGRDNDWLPDLPVLNAESQRNLLAGELSSSDNKTHNRANRVTETNSKPEASNDEDSLPLGVIVKKWNKTFEDLQDYQIAGHQQKYGQIQKTHCFQTVHNKATIKQDNIWVRADMHDFQVYTGKLADTTKFGLGEQGVINLMTGLENKNYIVYFDNFFEAIPKFKPYVPQEIGSIKALTCPGYFKKMCSM
ncbi:hypothetical protein QYM36_005220 [Artemia franciscana]|uniref:PiggyBac transposable element-derived protein domain-containing protein n=1 Tax=Artemia franciscana TaxID=6661 RepID=A0AA88ID78_ARTSF|nr:hypothetical protein QYM36_005220 [Artemia franciscana]